MSTQQINNYYRLRRELNKSSNKKAFDWWDEPSAKRALKELEKAYILLDEEDQARVSS